MIQSIPVVAEFFKVSFEQFRKDFIDCLGDASDEMIREIYDSLKPPVRSTEDAAGHDFFAPVDFCLDLEQEIIIPTGFCCDIARGWSLDLHPRSGQGFNFHLHLANTTGVVDSDYFKTDNEGHIKVKLVNGKVNGFTCEQGKAFVQGKFVPFGVAKGSENITRQRTGGFGSTDNK